MFFSKKWIWTNNLLIHLYHWFIMISYTLSIKSSFPVSFSFFSIWPIYSGDSFISLIYYDIIYFSLSLSEKLTKSFSCWKFSFKIISIWPIYSGDSFISLIYYDIIYSLKPRSNFRICSFQKIKISLLVFVLQYFYILWWFVYIIDLLWYHILSTL